MRTLDSLRLVLGFLSVLAAARGAEAAIFTSNVEIDLSLVTITSDGSGGQLIAGYGATLVSVTPFTPAAGDTLVTAVTFKNGDRLKIIDGPNAIDAIGPDYFESLTFYFAGSGSHSTSTTTVSFADLQGVLSDPTPGGSSNGVLAQALYPDFTTSQVSFTGLTLTTTISSLPGMQSYTQFGLWGGRAGGFEVISGSAPVPEPTSLLAWSAFGLLGLTRGILCRRNAKMPLAR